MSISQPTQIWPEPKALLATKEAAHRVGLSASTLEKLRVKGGGCPYIKIGTRVLYDPDDLATWLTSRRRSSTSVGA
jgi:excisionase family DNA binding protein